MALPAFSSFFPTVRRWINTQWRQEYKLIIDNDSGAPVGILSPNANGPEGIWAPVPLSQAQIAAPTAAMLADINATYQLNQAPYSRYRSDGSQLAPLDSESGTVVPPGVNVVWFSPLVITEAGGPLIIEGGVRLVA